LAAFRKKKAVKKKKETDESNPKKVEAEPVGANGAADTTLSSLSTRSDTSTLASDVSFIWLCIHLFFVYVSACELINW
jgi:hypothetical protein